MLIQQLIDLRQLINGKDRQISTPRAPVGAKTYLQNFFLYFNFYLLKEEDVIF